MDSHFNLIYDCLAHATKPKDKLKTSHSKSSVQAKAERPLSDLKQTAEEERKEPMNLPKSIQKRKKKLVRKAGQETWVDDTLDQWPENDFRIFCGNMGNEVNDDVLANAFKKYPSFCKAKVVRDKRTLKSKGFGFVSLTSVDDYIKAMREMQGKYVGNRPVVLRKSDWQHKSAFKRNN